MISFIIKTWIDLFSVRTSTLGALVNHPFPFSYIKRMGFSNRAIVHAYAVAVKGKDMAPTQNELGCAEAVNNIVNSVLGRPLGGELSTNKMYRSMLTDNLVTRYELKNALPGDIIISPTGYGNKKIISNGHVGILTNNGRVLSNNSRTGKWDDHWSLNTWIGYYKNKGGYPVYAFRIHG